MWRKNALYNILYFLMLTGLIACANKVTPTGGPKDLTPPGLLSSIPAYGQKEFHSSTISLTFDEYIGDDNLKDQLIITPRISFDYNFKIKKQTITLNFDGNFRDSTTYTLNFREGIVDITERNPAENMVLAFSTGSELDTLELTGTVMNLMHQTPEEKAVVGLYLESDTFNLFNSPPFYFTETHKNGNFSFHNIKADQYRVYAFQDENKNGYCQSEDEAYGFLPETIKLDTTLVLDTLELYKLNIDSFYVSRTRLSGHYFQLIANKYIMEAALTSDIPDTLYFDFTDDHKGLNLYNTFQIKDSLLVHATLTDSLSNKIDYAFYLHFNETSKRKPNEFKSITHIKTVAFKKPTVQADIVFSKPVRNVQLDSIVVRRDSIEYYSADSMKLEWNSLRNNLQLYFQLPQPVIDTLKANKVSATRNSGKDVKKTKGESSPRRYYLVLDSAVFFSVEQDTSERIREEITFSIPKNLGIIRGKVQTEETSYFIQLLDKSFNLVNEQKNGSFYVFKNISPGNYILRILVDKNHNGNWDIGNILTNQLSEPVIVYKDSKGNSKTAIRANWEVQVDLAF